MRMWIEFVRSLFVLCLTGTFIGLLFSGFWLLQHDWFRSTAEQTIHNNVAAVYGGLSVQAAATTRIWVIVDVAMLLASVGLGMYLRFLIRRRDRDRMDSM